MRLIRGVGVLGVEGWRVAQLGPSGLWCTLADAMVPPSRRVAEQLEAALYGACDTISDRFGGEAGYGSHDPLASD